MRTAHSLGLLLTLVFPGLALGVQTTNWKAAASLQAAAIVPGTGHYTFTNVATGEKLYYVPSGNHIFPSRATSGTPIHISPHKTENWIRFSFGSKNKCLSSAWGGQYDNAAVAYVCAVGSSAQKSTLEQTKQWWLAVPIDRTSAPSSSSANQQLIAAQGQSVATRNKKVAAWKKVAFHHKRDLSIEVDDDDLSLFEELTEEDLDEFTIDAEHIEGGESSLGRRSADGHSELIDRGLHASKPVFEKRDIVATADRAKTKRARAAKSSTSRRKKVIGTFYIIPSDHLIDQATRALTAQVVMSRGIKTTSIAPWRKGNKAQQWILTSC